MVSNEDNIPILTTTRELLQSNAGSQDNYLLLAEVRKNKGETVLNFDPDRRLCASSNTIRDLVLQQRGVRLPTSNEIFSRDPQWPSEWMIVGAGSFLWVSQIGSKKPLVMPLLLRNGRVLDTGMYNSASGGVGDDPASTAWRETNEEQCLLIRNGQHMSRAVFLPLGSTHCQSRDFAKSMVPVLESQETCIRAQLPPSLRFRSIGLRLIQTTPLECNNPGETTVQVEFPDRPWSRLSAQIDVNPARRNVNIHMVAQATLPAGELIQLDPEGNGRQTGPFTRQDVVRPDFPRTRSLEMYAVNLRKGAGQPPL